MSSKAGSASKIKIGSFDDLFGGNAACENGMEQIISVPLGELHTFKDHPFRVEDDEKMEETTESIRQYGVLIPGIARPREGGGYEIIAGHRRKRGSELAGKTEMPVIVRNYTDDEATIIMVDSNIQREDILPSEKARAYSMKYEAMKHQGSRGGVTLDEVGEAAGESRKTVQRYIWLARLISPLMEMTDSKKLGFIPAVSLSFLDTGAQQDVFDALEMTGAGLSAKKAEELKKKHEENLLTADLIYRILLSDNKDNSRKVVIKSEKITEYFPDEYSREDILEVIYGLLENWRAEGGTSEWKN